MKSDFENKFNNLISLVENKNARFLFLASHGFYNRMNDGDYLSRMFEARMNRKMDFDNPITYNEKLQWMKLNDHNPIYTLMGDKYLVKSYVAKIIGEKYIIPTIGVWDNPNDINFSNLPNKFVLKCNHNSGIGMFICKDKKHINEKKVIKALENGLKQDYYLSLREWPYKNIERKIIAEKYIGDTPKDYKFYMFNGKMDSVMVCTDRDKGHAIFRFYDEKWNRIYYQKPELEPDDDVDKPINLDKMITIAEKLSFGYPHVRVDLYNQEGNIYFGELTLFNQGGFDTDITYETDLKWGHLLDLHNNVNMYQPSNPHEIQR